MNEKKSAIRAHPWNTARKNRAGRSLVLVCVVVLFVLIVDLGGSGFFFLRATRLGGNVDPEMVDGLAVLFADFTRGGTLGPETRRRLNHCLWLYQHKQVTHIVCVGGSRPSRDRYGAKLMKQALVASGVHEDVVFVDMKSRDTRSNLRELLEIAEDYHWKKVAIITSPLHIDRVRRILSAIGKREGVILCPYSYATCEPRIRWTVLWVQIHHEWVSSILTVLLSAGHYQRLVDSIRS